MLDGNSHKKLIEDSTFYIFLETPLRLAWKTLNLNHEKWRWINYANFLKRQTSSELAKYSE